MNDELRRPAARNALGQGGFLLALIAATACAPASTPTFPSSDRIGDGRLLEARLLAAHNRARAAVGAPALRWDTSLAASAASYGPALDRLGRLQHSPRAGRPGQSENLWMGSRGAFAPEQMVGRWVEERTVFRAGVFPHVSSTGNWIDVAHYSQVIWPKTTAVGCAVHRGARDDYLICRYSPRGNVDGQPLS